jgi:hypothetical protein
MLDLSLAKTQDLIDEISRRLPNDGVSLDLSLATKQDLITELVGRQDFAGIVVHRPERHGGQFEMMSNLSDDDTARVLQESQIAHDSDCEDAVEEEFEDAFKEDTF